jgi:hypothetical protein
MAKEKPLRKVGGIPSLVRKGLLEVYKKPVPLISGKKLKILKLRRDEPSEPEE